MKRLLALMALCATAPVFAQGGLTRSLPGGGGGGGGGGEEEAAPEPTTYKYRFYVGADLQDAKLSVSDSNGLNGLPPGGYDTKFWDVRAGYRVLKAVALEAHYGFKEQDDNDPGRFKVDNYWGIFLVPTGHVLNLFELSFPIGYVRQNITAPINNTPTDIHLHSIAFGGNLEIPIREFWSALPDIRLTGGGMVYYQRSDAREYGFHYGLRYDFGFGKTQ
jgi:hypothetical protein